jgi:hypothetical protein
MDLPSCPDLPEFRGTGTMLGTNVQLRGPSETLSLVELTISGRSVQMDLLRSGSISGAAGNTCLGWVVALSLPL